MALRFLETTGARGRNDQPPGRLTPVDGRSPRTSSFAEVARSAAEELLDLLTSQIKLARAELAADVGHRLRRALRVALFVPPVLGGYVFAMAAFAFWLQQWWGRPAAFGAVAALQVVLGVVGIIWSVRATRARRAPLLEHARAEASETLQKTMAAVGDSGPLTATRVARTKGPSIDA